MGTRKDGKTRGFQLLVFSFPGKGHPLLVRRVLISHHLPAPFPAKRGGDPLRCAPQHQTLLSLGRRTRPGSTWRGWWPWC